MSNKLIALWDRFKSREYRESFIESHLSSTIAAQIFSMRSDRNMTQAELAIKAGMQQTRICVLEDPDNTSMSIKTLRRIAAAFDVALIIRFVPYSAVARWAAEANSQKFSVPSFDEDGRRPRNGGQDQASGHPSHSPGRTPPVEIMGETMTDKHTRRPWRIVDEIGGDLYVRDDGGVIAFCAKPMRWEGQDDRYTSEMAECCANASLITAAPDLLAALEAIVADWDDFNSVGDELRGEAYEQARAALSKAKGETT